MRVLAVQLIVSAGTIALLFGWSGFGAPPTRAAQQELGSEEVMVSAAPLGQRFILPSIRRQIYPELIIIGTNSALVSFLDSRQKYVVRAIRDRTVSDFFEMDYRLEGDQLARLSSIQCASRGSIVSSIRGNALTDDYALELVLLDPNGHRTEVGSGEINLPKQRSFPKSQGYHLDSIVNVDSEKGVYLVVGDFTETYFTRGFLLFSLDPEGYEKNCSLLFSNGMTTILERIEEKGRFYAKSCNYVMQQNGAGQSVWIRIQASPFSKTRTESICYSCRSGQGGWGSLLTLFSIDTKEFSYLADVSLAAAGQDAFVLWARDLDGLYSVHLRDGVPDMETIKIGNWDGNDSARAEGIAMMDKAPFCDIWCDSSGNAIAVWALNRRIEHKYPNGLVMHTIVVATCDRGKWSSGLVVSQGAGFVRAPRIAVDSANQVHIAYFKQMRGYDFGCFYRKIPVLRP